MILSATNGRKQIRRPRQGADAGFDLDKLLRAIRKKGWKAGLAHSDYRAMMQAGFQWETLLLAAIATEVTLRQHPLTLRGLLYLIVSAGELPSTDKEHYQRLGRIMTILREADI